MQNGDRPLIHDLHRRAQHLVPAHDLAERGGEREAIERPFRVEAEGNVVRAILGLELREEPQALLPERGGAAGP